MRKFDYEKRKKYCDNCKHYKERKIHKQEKRCWHPKNVKEKIIIVRDDFLCKETKSEFEFIKKASERNENNDCRYYKKYYIHCQSNVERIREHRNTIKKQQE